MGGLGSTRLDRHARASGTSETEGRISCRAADLIVRHALGQAPRPRSRVHPPLPRLPAQLRKFVLVWRTSLSRRGSNATLILWSSRRSGSDRRGSPAPTLVRSPRRLDFLEEAFEDEFCTQISSSVPVKRGDGARRFMRRVQSFLGKCGRSVAGRGARRDDPAPTSAARDAHA
jgi:hypothetical protein